MTLETSELLLLGEKFRETHGEYPKLIFVIRPGNPSAKGAMRQDWEELAQVALKWRARLVNDGAYTTLARPGTHTPLSEVAPSIPELEWLELFSVSKALSDPGARLGVSIGSADFIEDLRIVKGNTDSGAVPHVMAAYGSLFRDQPLSARLLTEIREIYQKRVEILVPKLKACGFQEACETTAGFFTLWKMPKRVNQKSALEWQEYYQRVEDSRDGRKVSRAEAIHRAILDATGVLGVHFSGSEDLLRFAVCTDLQEESRVRGYWERLSRVEIG
jgi:aspartate/methionine/tyrosine aminotransferase